MSEHNLEIEPYNWDIKKDGLWIPKSQLAKPTNIDEAIRKMDEACNGKDGVKKSKQ